MRVKRTPEMIGYTIGVVMVLVVLACIVSGCALAPDAISLDAAHTSHHWGETKAPYEFGKDTAGIGQHWKRGQLSIDLAEYAQDCKDGLHPEFSAKASYVIPIQH